jgi:hypothetical protein
MLTKDLLFKIEMSTAHFACGRIKKTDEGFSIMAEHGGILSQNTDGRVRMEDGAKPAFISSILHHPIF